MPLELCSDPVLTHFIPQPPRYWALVSYPRIHRCTRCRHSVPSCENTYLTRGVSICLLPYFQVVWIAFWLQIFMMVRVNEVALRCKTNWNQIKYIKDMLKKKHTHNSGLKNPGINQKLECIPVSNPKMENCLLVKYVFNMGHFAVFVFFNVLCSEPSHVCFLLSLLFWGYFCDRREKIAAQSVILSWTPEVSVEGKSLWMQLDHCGNTGLNL